MNRRRTIDTIRTSAKKTNSKLDGIGANIGKRRGDAITKNFDALGGGTGYGGKGTNGKIRIRGIPRTGNLGATLA